MPLLQHSPLVNRTVAQKKGRALTPLLLLGPSLLLLLGIVAYPALYAVRLSFYEISLLMPQLGRYVGIKNYLTLVQDGTFWLIARNSLVWVFGCVASQLAGGLIGASILNLKFAGRSFFRGLALIPWATPSVLVALMWMWMLDGNYGVLNDILLKMGLTTQYIPWLAQAHTALPSVMLADIWQGIPFFAVMLLAALQAIPSELFEAARIDGCGSLRMFWHIKIPLILPSILITTMLRIIWTANYMDLILIMTGGGPGYSSMTLPVLSYTSAYRRLQIGYGASVAVFQALFLSLVAWAYVRLFRKVPS